MWFIVIIILVLIVLIYKTEEYPVDNTLGQNAKQITSIQFNNYPIMNNQHLSKKILATPPVVQFNGKEGKYHTFMMIDIDDPTPNNGSELRHWLVINVPSGAMIDNSSQTLSPYLSPDPIVGKHRYHLRLYEQSQLLNIGIDPDRYNWDSEGFAKQMELTLVGQVQILCGVN